MATGAGKTFTAITAAYRLLKFGKVNRILFLVDTKSLGEQAIIDGVNVSEDIFTIETNVTQNGAHLMKQLIEYRNRLSREKRWQQLDEEIDYKPLQLDRDIVNPSQIRTVIRTCGFTIFEPIFISL